MKTKDVVEGMVKSHTRGLKLQYPATFTNNITEEISNSFEYVGISGNGEAEFKDPNGQTFTGPQLTKFIKERGAHYEEISKPWFAKSNSSADCRLDALTNMVEELIRKNDLVYKPGLKKKVPNPPEAIAKKINEQFALDNINGEFMLRRRIDNLYSEPVDPKEIILASHLSYFDLEESDYQKRETETKIRDKVVHRMGYPNVWTLKKENKEAYLNAQIETEKKRHFRVKSDLETIPYSPSIQRRVIEEKILSELGYATERELDQEGRSALSRKKFFMQEELNYFFDEKGNKQSLKAINLELTAKEATPESTE